jgi:triosephosphate isomerase (TIM)
VQRQVVEGLALVSAKDAEDVVVAYEPIWAIGTGRTATAADANATIATIRATLRQVVGDVAEHIRVLYGGSVKPGNAAELMAQPDIDGALVGGASLDPDEFARIIQYGH